MNANTNYKNSWDNHVRSASYAKLEFPNSYYLAYRDLSQIIETHVTGRRALDFGCGTGRSSRFLKKLGIQTIGIDISPAMIKKAREIDPQGRYEPVADCFYDGIGKDFDLIFSIFTFDNIPEEEHRVDIMISLKNLLSKNGILIMLDASSEMYTREWASFTSSDFPENRNAKSGEIVKICMTDVEDQSPVEDYFWTREDYKRQFEKAGLKLIAEYAPLGKKEEPFPWKSELETAPWLIHVLKH
jgi:SAM-dependent methyltransferase